MAPTQSCCLMDKNCPRACGRKRHRAKAAELSFLLLLASGLALFAPFGLSWLLARWVLLLHVVLALILVPAVVLPFLLHHRRRLKTSRRRFHIVSGHILEIGLALLFLSGGWLFFWGWNGSRTGALMHWLHLGLSLPLVVLIVAHAWRFSLLRRMVTLGGALAVGLAVSQPVHAAPSSAPAAVESRSLLLEPGGKSLLSANFEAGSVSRIDRTTGQRLEETVLGGNVTAVAEDRADGLVAATDFRSGTLFLLARSDLALKRRVALPVKRTAGVVYDARNGLFWVAAPEDNRLLGVLPDGKVWADVAVPESPMGLALLPDGRLLVSHSMIGAVTLWNVATPVPRLEKRIDLAVEQNPDESISQGLPRGLNRIVVSPDGKQAWLPHMLWNFDHPFQFQETVFPAVSVLSLKPGAERELPFRRKQLFKQINITEDGNRTRVVSNPADAGFSADGKKVFVTLSGSEDLVVFDLARALPVDSRSKKAKTTPGANAVQIYRHLPGEMPDGIVVSGGDIYIQNRMGMTLTHALTGGKGSFAQVSVSEADFAQTVGQDPLPPKLRRGTRLFFLANTSATPEAPMAGDNWMSCSSCHVEGFNFTNRALFRATPVDKFHSSFTGHGSIKALVSGDFIADYIRMVRNTQGGMGADTRFPAPETDPEHPSPEVKGMMEDLHAFVTSDGNLPLLATWLRGPGGSGHVAPASWTHASLCADCHSALTQQWETSLHHLSASSDPYYVVAEDLAAEDAGEGFRGWCRGCHAPQGALSGVKATVANPHLFTATGDYAQPFGVPETAPDGTGIGEGIGCLTCHAVASVEASGGDAGGNDSLTLDPAGRAVYPFETSENGALQWVGDRLIRARPKPHAQSLMRNLGGEASVRVCAACHEEYSPGVGAYIVDTYQEWKASPYNAPDDPARNRTCIDCHMHASVESTGTDVPGRATDHGPLRPNVATHRFVGAQYHLAGLRDPEARAESIALLQSAASVSVKMSGPGRLTVRVSNSGAGHTLPTGVSDFRQMWLRLTVRDATGKVVLDDGALTPDGHLPADARVFVKVFDGVHGHAVGLRFWRLAKYDRDTRIPAGGFRDEGFDLPPGTVYPVHVEARLMFRTFPQDFTDAVLARYPEMPAPQPVEMAHVAATLTQD